LKYWNRGTRELRCFHNHRLPSDDLWGRMSNRLMMLGFLLLCLFSISIIYLQFGQLGGENGPGVDDDDPEKVEVSGGQKWLEEEGE